MIKNLFRFLTIVILSFMYFSPLVAEDKVVVIDIEYLIQNSNIGKKILKNINDLNDRNIKKLETKNEELKKIELEIKNKKNIISEPEFNKEVKNFQQKIKIFTNEKNKIAREYNDFRTKELENVFKLFNPIIKDYMEKNSIDIILNTKDIFMVNKSTNLTNDILELINNKIK